MATKKTTRGAKKTVPVMFVGVRGAGVTSLVRALTPDGDATESIAKLPDTLAIDGERPKGRRRAAAAVTVRQATLEGARVALHDVPGDGRASDADHDEQRFGLLLTSLQAAQIVVHVIDATDRDPERMGARLDRWIHGSWHDEHAVVIPVLSKRDAAKASAVKALSAVWPGAIEVSAKTGAGLPALARAIAAATKSKRPRPPKPTGLAALSLPDIQLALIARTHAPGFDGAAIAKELGALVKRGDVRGLVFLREGEGTYGARALEREPDGLRFLGRLSENVWDADTLHIVAKSEAKAKALAERARTVWAAREVDVLERVMTRSPQERVVRARFDVTGIASRARAGAPTVQALQLELVRRSGYNAFRGDRIAASLASHRDAWRAVAFGRLRTRLGGPDTFEVPTYLNTATEMEGGYWNADQLWVVVPDAEAEKRIRRLGELHWFADNIVTLQGREAKRVANVHAPARVVELWWD